MTGQMSFAECWAALARIGREPVGGGYHRFAWTPTDRSLRSWFRDQAARRDLSLEADRNGNLWAWWGDPGAGAVVTGSHLDSVPGGGAFDGPLGVVSSFYAIDEMRRRGVTPSRPIAVVDFADEEGARFGVACMGSRLMTGILAPDRARALRDADGTSLGDAMTAAGVDAAAIGRDDQALDRIGTFVELHVEQGRSLVDLGAAVGVASAIWPHGRWRCSFTGEPNHAGTTRLGDRRDPMLPFAATVLAAREFAERNDAVATIGKVVIDPGAVNGIASRVDAWLDTRAPDDATVQTVLSGVTDAAERAADRHGVTVEVVQESYTPEVAFADDLRDRVSRLLDAAPQLPTGAGHDAGILSAFVPSTMLFVRNPTGISHSPAEHAEIDDCLAGVTALATVLTDLSIR